MESKMNEIIQTLGIEDTFFKVTGCTSAQTYITKRVDAGLCLDAIKLEFCMILQKVNT